ncbi:MAG TPA: dienelactone hydrolase family protein, partial [Candidatus Omnitrophota bacterium]|nr:dienelactone hydrolase family protein [Candidatus Omnitrophota bacterium]
MRILLAAALAVMMAVPAMAEVVTEKTGWKNPKDGTDVPAYVFYDPAKARPDGTHPAILFLHARRGIQEADKKYLAEIAAEGFLVLAPDWQTGRFIEAWPVPHDPATELDAALGLDQFKTMKRVRPNEKRALFGYSRGGYYAVRIAAGALDPRHKDQVACVVAIAGHFQDPNRPEADQVYRTMPELDTLSQPVMMVIGEDDTGARVDNNARAFYSLVDRGADVELVYLPKARRAFDFRD